MRAPSRADDDANVRRRATMLLPACDDLEPLPS
jgi:hypothetical protein